MMDINFMMVFGTGFIGGCGVSFAFYTLLTSVGDYKKDLQIINWRYQTDKPVGPPNTKLNGDPID
jgi:hypothetical protein